MHEAWVTAFAEGWRAPTDADSFSDHFERLFHPQARLIQPQTPVVVGHRGFREEFARPLFELMPDLHGTVDGWAESGDVVYIEIRLEGTLGRRKVTIKSVDKVTFKDGLAVERVAHTDTTPLLAAVALTPTAWPKFASAQARMLARRLRPGRRAS